MNHSTAQLIVELTLRQAKELRESVPRIAEMEEREDAERYRDAVAKILEEMLYGILKPIFAEHPDLKPSEMI